MSFKDKLRIHDLLGFMSAPARKALLYVLDDADSSYKPVTESMLANSGSTGGGSDPASAREATLGEVRDRLRVLPTTILGRQTLTLTDIAQALTVPAGATGATIGVRGGSASVACAAPAPTATSGLLWSDGSSWGLEAYELVSLRAVIATGAPVLDVTYVGTTPVGGTGTGNGTTPAPGAGTAYRHYRLLVTDLISGANNNYTGVMELVLRTQAGGPQAAQGGTATASASAGLSPAQAFDGTVAQNTGWVVGTGLSDDQTTHLPTPIWLAYEFPSPTAIVEYVVHRYPYNDVGSSSRSVGGWQLQGSQDGTTWTTLDTTTTTAAEIGSATGATRAVAGGN
ncbi:hypothetical protein [uncultured Deinococcus sp.]|uniref:hypothetical protein n=1 Tax=uncultured Deinococcus sp. TaxID=158789 RepID=UPI002591238A|nr:hypothetical protein [uncultured Deinococcus sp.]